MAETFIDKYGNRRFKNSGKKVSRWVATKKMGRPLKSGEVVHHKDRDKSNNSRSNLWVFKNQDEHTKTHKKDKKKTGYW